MFALRFRAYGERRYLTLGTAAEGWTRQRAERELRHVLADVERGIWVPSAPDRAADRIRAPTFHEFASEWLEARSRELRETTVADYSWQLSNHLLPFFHRHHLPQITVAEVDRYREHKVARGPRCRAESINKTITRLGQILAVAEERELIARNPVRVNTRNRKLKARAPAPGLPRQRRADPGAARRRGRLDASATAAHEPGAARFIATLVFAGLRIGEASALRWRDIDLAAGRIAVGASKTEAGERDRRHPPGAARRADRPTS